MYFIIREGRFLDMTMRRIPFRAFLDSGFSGHQATMADWDMHLSTLFPEVRLRPHVEVRCADSLPPHLVLTVAALLKGLMYDEQAFQAAWENCRPDSLEETAQACRQAWRLGLKAPWKTGTLQELARTCLDLARSGLDRQSSRRGQERSESCFLDSLDSLVDGGETLAEQLLQSWHGSREEKLRALIAHCGFFDVSSPLLDKNCAQTQVGAED